MFFTKNTIMKYSILFLISIFTFSCQQKENKIAPVDTTDPVVNEKKIEVKNKEENKQTSDTIFMNFMNEKGFYTAESSLDSVHSKVYVKFMNENPGELNATLIPTTGKGNIRFNQIIFPDKNSDGPFGMDLKIPLSQKGNHILVIGHSLMADNPYYGKFEVKLENKKQ